VKLEKLIIKPFAYLVSQVSRYAQKGFNIKSILNYIKIDKNISTSGRLEKEQIKLVAKKGFDVIINLAMHNKGALPKEDKIVTKNKMIYIHIPIVWKNPKISRLKLFLNILKALQENNKKVFIHCIMNYRVSVFIYQYKKTILKQKNLKQKNLKFKAPKKFKPNKKWQKLINLNIKA